MKCNVIVPAAVTRMAEGIDTSAYPPMGPELVAPVVGWLAHESCSVTGEMFVALAGRVARAVVAETPGVYRPSWSIEDVGEHMDAIRDAAAPVDLSRSCPTVTPTTSATASWAEQGPETVKGAEPSDSGRTARWPACAWSTSPRW